MKNIKIAILVLSSIILSYSCTKTKVEPEYILNGDAPAKTLVLVEGQLNGAYAAFRSVDYYGGPQGSGAFSTLPDLMGSDFQETFESLGNWRKMSEWNFASDETWVENTWAATYRVISRANLVLRDVDNFATSDPKAVNRIKGQALAIRAHAHFDVMRYWAPDFGRNSTSLAAPYMDKFEIIASKPSRITVKDYYDKILADLEAAKGLLAPGSIDIPYGNNGNRSKIDQVAVFAMLARVNLYAGVWADAAANADLAIAARPITELSDFSKIWRDQPNTETIWTVNFETANEGSVYSNIYSPSSNPSRLTYQPTVDMVDDLSLYSLSDGRFDVYMVYDLVRPVLLKHRGKGTANDGLVNWKCYRSGEMALISAEAKAKIGGQDAAALTTLNSLRSKRYFSASYPTPATNTALISEILRQKRLELFAEGQRFFEQKRLGKTTFTRAGCAAGGFPTTVCTIQSTNRSWTFPIPFDERKANPNLAQNGGY